MGRKIPKTDKEKAVEEFLSKLSELCAAYSMSLGGCGCQGSPWLAHKKHVVAECLSVSEVGNMNFRKPRQS